MFLLTYFRSEMEALHYALSEDGLYWRALNGSRPVLHSGVGARSIRDPFIVRDKSGVFHALSTNGWKSEFIWHAVSNDLIAWRNEELLGVMEGVAGAVNAWAPEAFYDVEAGLYRLLWSSATGKANGRDDWNHRIWSVSTTDWQEYSRPELFFDPGFSVIDACIAREENGGYLMAFKDERDTSTSGGCGKAICVARAPRGNGPWTVEEPFIVPPSVEGPALFWREDAQLGAGWTLIYDFFTATGFGAAHCADGRNWQDITARAFFPDTPRHAGVLQVSREEAERIENYFGLSVNGMDNCV